MEKDNRFKKDAENQGNSVIAKFHVFKGEEYLGWDCFSRKRIMAGSSCWADLVLPGGCEEGRGVEGISALFTISPDGVLVEDFSTGKQVMVKGQPVNSCILGPLDYVTIGPYSIKIKLSLICEERDREDSTDDVKNEIEAINLDSTYEPVLSVNDDRLVKPVDWSDFVKQAGFVDKYLEVAPKNTLECLLSDSVQVDDESPQVIMDIIEEIALAEDVSSAIDLDEIPACDNLVHFKTPVPVLPEDLEAAAEDDDLEADFNLKDILRPGSSARTTEEPVLEVVKTWNDTVIDIKFLNVREKYFAFNNGRKFRLAEHRKGKFYYYFNERFTGFLSEKDGGIQSTASMESQSKLVSRRKRIFRNELSHDAEIRFSDGSFDYLVRPAIRMMSPGISLPPREKSTFKKNLLQSGSFHIVFMMFLGFFFSLPTIKQAPLPESKFVKVDISQFVKQELPKTVEKKEIVKKEIKKPAPQPERKIVKIKNLKRKQKVAKRKKAQPKVKVVAGRKPTPKGGSAKKGNVVKKDVSQTGMLAILSKSGISLQPSIAMASVTNLDAVAASVNADRGGYKVSGVVASLGDAKVELPSSGGIVDTQGSATILSSGDQIASLDTGATGQRQVQSIVSATLDRNVLVKGGISREDVKKVIDRHIDEIQYCYESALINNPAIMGKLVLEWKILSDGRVGEIPIKSSTLNSSTITSCVKKSIKSWRFPEPDGSESVIVSYPFIFDIVGF